MVETAETRVKQRLGNVIVCNSLLLHHLEPGNLWESVLLQFSPGCPWAERLPISQRVEEVLSYREKIMREEAQEILSRLERIESVARKEGLASVLQILEEEFEFGHDLEDTAE